MTHKTYCFGELSPRDQFIVGQMALDGIPPSAQQFFINVIDWLATDFVTTKALAKNQSYSDRTVTNYMRLFRQKGYVVRYNYRAWVLGREEPNGKVGNILRDDNVFGKCARREGVHL